jgi:hypothetical protein
MLEHNNKQSHSSLSKQRMEQKICISYFDDESLEMWKNDSVKRVHHFKKVKKYGKNSIVVFVNKTNKTIIGYCILKSDFKVKEDLLDPDTYVGDYAKYNKYEADIKQYELFETGVSFEDVNSICGIVDTKCKSNLSKLTATNFAMPFYKGKDAESVLTNYRELVLSWI